MNPAKRTLGTAVRVAGRQPFAVFCLVSVISVPAATAFARDFQSAYMLTGLAVLVSAVATLGTMILADRLDGRRPNDR